MALHMHMPSTIKTRTKEGKEKKMNWHEQAACRGLGPDLFFARRGENTTQDAYHHAKQLCAQCPVATDCLETALRIEENPQMGRHGLYGGKTPDQRADIARRQRRQVA